MAHRYDPGPYARCKTLVPDNGGNMRECGNHRSHTNHRTYLCRTEGCSTAREEYASIETRDKHEAIEHGSGW